MLVAYFEAGQSCGGEKVDGGARLKAVPRTDGGEGRELCYRSYSLSNSRLDEEAIPAFC